MRIGRAPYRAIFTQGAGMPTFDPRCRRREQRLPARCPGRVIMRQRRYLAIAALAAVAAATIPAKSQAHDHRSGPAAIVMRSGSGFGVPSHAAGFSGDGFRSPHFGQVIGPCAPRFRNGVLVNSVRGPIFVTPSFGRFRTGNVVIFGGQPRQPAWMPTFGARGYAPVHTRLLIN
jgi:hypothetical protein